jgi:hypothetical protein
LWERGPGLPLPLERAESRERVLEPERRALWERVGLWERGPVLPVPVLERGWPVPREQAESRERVSEPER